MTMRFLELKIPPPVLGVAALAVMLTAWFFQFCLIEIPYKILLSVCCGMVGCAVLLPSLFQFCCAKTTTMPHCPERASRLVVTGLYGISRNPMYVGATLILLALALFFEDGVAVMTALSYPIYLNFFQIIPEERALESKFAEEYREYKKRVRRWI